MYTESETGAGSDPLVQNLLSELNCSGSEERLADCDHNGVGMVPIGCSRATVKCKNKGMEECLKKNNIMCQIPTSYVGLALINS